MPDRRPPDASWPDRSSPDARDLLWTPTPERVAGAALSAFRLRAQRHAGRALPDYDALHAWSVREAESFWRFYATDAGLPWAAPPGRAMSADPMPDTRWFEGGTLSYARALLYPAGLRSDDADALVGLTEAGAERRLSYAQLRELVARVQEGLRREGVGPNDAVVAFAANVPETVAVLLACAGLGALFASCSPDFGGEAAAARFAQLRPKVVFASPVYRYGGRRFDTTATVRDLARRLPGDVATVLLPYPGEEAPEAGVGATWEGWLPAAAAAPEPELRPLPFDHPLYVLFSSGTTGLPKAMVHRAGGALLSHHKEHRLHSDIRPGDVVFYFTTCGWMMWNWLVSALAQAATVVLYDGSPAEPDPLALWRMAERERVTFFGTSARFLHSLQAHAARPGAEADLHALRTVASTGSPLSPGGFRYVYREISADVHLASISGGTDIVSCFMLGVPTLPVIAGEIQRPGLGVDLAVFDERGNDVRGVAGELVCRRPLPSMPLRFLGDPSGERYHDAYFSTYPGLWRHGDLIERTPAGGIVVYGRSDATLNPGGVRIGTAEVYRPLEALPEVLEAAAVGYRGHGDEEIWLLLVLRPGVVLDEALARRVRDTLRRHASPRHVPRRIVQVPHLPHTRSGKLVEIAVARLVNGEEVRNASVMANPEALDGIRAALEQGESF